MLYPATREQTIHGSEARQLSKNTCDPDSGKYGRGRETPDVDMRNTDMYNLHKGKYEQCMYLLHRFFERRSFFYSGALSFDASWNMVQSSGNILVPMHAILQIFCTNNTVLLTWGTTSIMAMKFYNRAFCYLNIS